MIDKIAIWSFNIGVLWFFIGLIFGAIGYMVTWTYVWPCIPLIFIPKFLWSFGIMKDPYG